MALLRVLGGRNAALAVLTAVTALYMALVAFTNVTDYPTNHAFVQHVFAMDTTFGSPTTMWRAVTSPALVTAAYVAIIAWEAVSALVLTAAAVLWARALATGRGAATARQLSSAGWLMWVALFGGGFIAVGGEWFLMWQSEQWNGLDAALQNLLIAGLGLVLAHLPGGRDTETSAGLAR
ncbi:DUF2165 domain-containing protein [Streptomonospora sp. S1-112]|uniref:DUF2165 domain-containing protein n=1 Tax=Streptomonospora mangrovi TaxID=2883123 RepID=A0A9X3NXL6_9ACTN|nr:DUF2165 domain-containing protein [Streptomonospora mangrovi]MDA0566211.1 DUF2165 domain-containing protein [Streptomonospora mangrovi]